MNWRALAISFAIGIAVDIGLVWLYYAFIGQAFQWTGFWIWQGILWGAGILIWLRKLLGFSIWYMFHGREALAREAFESFVTHGFDDFNPEWDNVESWLDQHLKFDPRMQAAVGLALSNELMRSQGIWQLSMTRSAYKKAAIRYSKILKRRNQGDAQVGRFS